MGTTPTLAHAANKGSQVNRFLFIALIVLTAVLFPPFATRQPWHETFSAYFIAIVLEAVPYILIGSLLAGLIEMFMPASLLPRITKRLGLLGIPATAIVAPAFPACECGVLAVARGLLRKGLPLPHTITYLLAGPILNPTVLFTTWLAFQDARYPILRGIGGLLVAIIIGYIVWRISSKRILLPQVVASLERGEHSHEHNHDHNHDHSHDHNHNHDHAHGDGCDDGCGHDDKPALNLGTALKKSAGTLAKPRRSLRATFGQLSSHVLDHFLEMAAFFLMGVFIAAAMKTYFGNAAFANFADNIVLASLAMMLTAFILSLCAEADAFVAASFKDMFPIGGQMEPLMAFLVYGPMFDIKLFLMYRLVFRTGFIIAIAVALTVLTLAYVIFLVPVLNRLLLDIGIGTGPL